MGDSGARQNDCDVLWSSVRHLRPHHADLLDVAEHGRRERYTREADRDRFTLGATLMRIALGWRFGVAPDALEIDRTCPRCGEPHGKPRAVGRDVHVSVTHSGDYAAVAVTAAGPVGVDIELIRTLEHDRIADKVCTPEERRTVVTKEDLFVYWARKESVLKATGHGLAVPMRSVAVTGPGEAPRLLHGPDGTTTAAMIDVSPDPAYAGAATVLAGGAVEFRLSDVGERVAEA